MGFSENLQILRKMKNMSQEQLAERLDVSRQAVSKWESGNGYPETEKLISICEIFDCSMDEIIKGKFSADVNGEKKSYEKLMSKFSKGIALAIGIILLGTTILLYFSGLLGTEELKEKNEIMGVVILLLCVLIAVPIFIILGMQREEFIKKNPKLANIYSEEENEKFNSKFQKSLAGSVALILLGTILLIFVSGMKLVDEESTIPVVILMAFVTIAVPIIVYFGIQKDKYDIEKYNKENSEEYKKENSKVGKISGVIMLIATILFLISGLIYNMWYINWIVYPIGGIMCGIVGTIFNREQ